MRLPKLVLYVFFGSGIIIFFPESANAQIVNIYVSMTGNDNAPGTINHPIQTLHRAQQLLHHIRKQYPLSPVNIFLRGGTYYLDSTLVFATEDNPDGNIPVTFQNYENEEVVLSGGHRLFLKWKLGKNGIYQATVPVTYNFDQLFVNGIKQVRARYPNYNPSVAIFDGYSKDALSPSRIKTWHHPAGGFIHALQSGHWGSLSYHIIGKSNDSVLRVEGGWQINRINTIDSNFVYVENIKEELDTAHEWYYDRGKKMLYYMPPKGLKLQQAKIEVAVLKELIAFKGDTIHPVKNIHFKGITFTQSKETFMQTREPLLRGDWSIFRGGAILLNGTEQCTFSNCNFESLGGNALFFSNYNRYDAVQHCLIRDAGASGICLVGNPSAVRSPSFNYNHYVPYHQLDKTPGPKNKDFPKDCYVYDNLIYNIGRVEKQTAGVELSMCMDISVVHNSIYHVPRAGININDGCWGGDLIEDNDVFETVLETSDHGSFNSWGRDRYWSPDRHYMDSIVAVHPELVRLDVIQPITLRHNRFRCDHGWDIDLDDGSSNYIIDSNLCLNGGIKNREGFYRTVENNIMVNNTFHPHVWFKNSHAKFMHNIMMKPYAPIGISYWRDSIDYNSFPDTAALIQARINGTDTHSVACHPFFYNPMKGDFRVRINDTTCSIGFHNFSMHNFGVISPQLRALARQPHFPVPVYPDKVDDGGQALKWEGAVLKRVQGINEQSVLGLPEAEGIYITRLASGSPAYRKGLRKNDVILVIGNTKIHSFNNLQRALEKYKHEKRVNVYIYRYQKELRLIINFE